MKKNWRLFWIGIVAAHFCSSSARGEFLFTNLFSFNYANGSGPETLVQAGDGNLYGTTESGGGYTTGTLFRMTPNGSVTTLRSFSGPDGYYPNNSSGLALGNSGILYGTTPSGGTNDTFYGGDGTVFGIDLSGSFTFSFSCSHEDAYEPGHGVVLGSDGYLYGTTTVGGLGYGTVFRMTTNGIFTNLFTCSQTEAMQPGALIQANDGNFYGQSFYGGVNGLGSIFKITPDGVLTTVFSFHDFDGRNSQNRLLQGSDGNIYGTTTYGGAYTNGVGYRVYGTVFRITTNGVLTTLHSFNEVDGSQPMAGLVEGRDGNFYGVAYQGGANNKGTIFQISTNGDFILLYSFSGDDGENPSAELIQGSDGKLYGTTEGTGNYNHGTIFRFSFPEPPIVQASGSTNGNITLRWSADVGEIFQVQYASDLSSGSWSSLGNSITATNSVVSVTYNPGPDVQRFYRVQVLP